MEICSFGNWERNVKLSNDHAELIITLEVGPRLIHFSRPGKPNVFKQYQEMIGNKGEDMWMIRGGSRLWVGPESLMTYAPDNTPVNHEKLSENHVVITAPADPEYGLEKAMDIEMEPDSSRVHICHRITNRSEKNYRNICAWEINVMAAGGKAIIPQPPTNKHQGGPQPDPSTNFAAMLPGRRFIFWPYTNIADPRFTWGPKSVCISQSTEGEATKIGSTHTLGYAGYQHGDTVFLTTVPYVDGARYLDMGCNMEVFTNPDMLEVEILSPICDLAPSQSISLEQTLALIEYTDPVDGNTSLCHVARPALGI